MAKSLSTAINVMRAADRGEEIEFRKYGTSQWSTLLPNSDIMSYNWFEFDYRVKPKPQKFWIVFAKNGTLLQWSLTKKPEAPPHWANDWIVEEYERTPR